jgi:aspartate 1-decarboxylase
MFLKVLRAKIHRATVTESRPDYVGSIAIDEALLEASGIRPNEFVLVGNLANGARFETYAILAPRGSGTVAVNGAAARLARPGDLLIILAHAYATPEEAGGVRPTIVHVNERNRRIPEP